MPVSDNDSVYIESVSARTIEEARDKFLRKIEYTYDLDVYCDLDECIEANPDIRLGEIYDVESF